MSFPLQRHSPPDSVDFSWPHAPFSCVFCVLLPKYIDGILQKERISGHTLPCDFFPKDLELVSTPLPAHVTVITAACPFQRATLGHCCAPCPHGLCEMAWGTFAACLAVAGCKTWVLPIAFVMEMAPSLPKMPDLCFLITAKIVCVAGTTSFSRLVFK